MAAHPQGPPVGLLFRHLAESPEFAEFALILQRLTGLAMALNTPGATSAMTGVPKEPGNRLCLIIRNTPEGLRRCSECDRKFQAKSADEGRAKLYTCHAGFYDMAIPIMVQGRLVATISSGQVLPEPPGDAGFRRLRRRLDWLDASDRQLRRAYADAPWLPRHHLKHVMRLLEIFAGQLCDSAWRFREMEARLERDEIRAAKKLIEERFRDPELELAAVAACARLSPAHFSHTFHREVGTTLTAYVQSRRVEEAKRLLAGSGKSVTEICFECGFNSLTHFNRVFRRGELSSPTQYRERRRSGTGDPLTSTSVARRPLARHHPVHGTHPFDGTARSAGRGGT